MWHAVPPLPQLGRQKVMQLRLLSVGHSNVAPVGVVWAHGFSTTWSALEMQWQTCFCSIALRLCLCLCVFLCVCGGNPCSEGLLSHVQFLVSVPTLQAGGTRHPWPTVCNEATVLDGISGLITLTYLQFVMMFFHYPSVLMTFRVLFCHMHE